MKRGYLLVGIIGFLVSIGFAASARAADALRLRTNINREWKFSIGDHPGAEVSTFDDSKWEAIGLPHSFSAPYFQGKNFYVGYGWYRKSFDVPAERR